MSKKKCEVVRYRLNPHPDADFLSIAVVKGWQCVVKTADFPQVEGLALYVPIDMVLPEAPAWEFLRKTKFRVRTIKLRGIVSQGLLLPLPANYPLPMLEGDDVTGFLAARDYIPPEPAMNTGGGQPSGWDNDPTPPGFSDYTEIEHFQNYPDVIQSGERVVITEKLHGTNAKFGLLDGQFYVGDHHHTKRRAENNLHWSIALRHNIEEAMRRVLDPHYKNAIVYGEIYGRVQKLRYGLPNGYALRVFDIAVANENTRGHRYLGFALTEQLTYQMCLTPVPALIRGPFAHDMLSFRNGPAFQGGHTREGIVIHLNSERFDPSLGRVILKYVGEDYHLQRHE